MEYIEREAAITTALEASEVHPSGMACLKQALLDLPAADVVPVVRCRDCKYLYQEDLYEFWCNGFCQPARLVTADDYCSHGQRRE